MFMPGNALKMQMFFQYDKTIVLKIKGKSIGPGGR